MVAIDRLTTKGCEMAFRRPSLRSVCSTRNAERQSPDRRDRPDCTSTTPRYAVVSQNLVARYSKSISRIDRRSDCGRCEAFRYPCVLAVGPYTSMTLDQLLVIPSVRFVCSPHSHDTPTSLLQDLSFTLPWLQYGPFRDTIDSAPPQRFLRERLIYIKVQQESWDRENPPALGLSARTNHFGP